MGDTIKPFSRAPTTHFLGPPPPTCFSIQFHGFFYSFFGKMRNRSRFTIRFFDMGVGHIPPETEAKGPPEKVDG